uniref:Uncharacterized protein n=1 Tax=Setaria digitata TaxID=48799 RepID=A0A915Q0E4_9BILA
MTKERIVESDVCVNWPEKFESTFDLWSKILSAILLQNIRDFPADQYDIHQDSIIPTNSQLRPVTELLHS